MLFCELFKMFGNPVDWWDIVVAVLVVALLACIIAFIVRDIKRGKAKREQKATATAEALAGDPAAGITTTGAAGEKEGKRARKKKKKKGKRGTDKTDDAEPLVRILGFDPYAPFNPSALDMTDEFYDDALETEDMRNLREKMRAAKVAEGRLGQYRERDEKIRYELGKVERYLRDNRVVLSSAAAVSAKLNAQLAELTADRKTARANRARVSAITKQLTGANRNTDALRRAVDLRANDERLLKEAQNHVLGEIARAERDLSLINADIDRLNASVGMEMRQIENENRARALMGKYSELKPLLIGVNSAYREIAALDRQINAIHATKREIRSRLDGLMNDLKVAYGAAETDKVAQSVDENNARMLDLDRQEEQLLGEKETKIREFRSAKRKANEFLDREKYSFDDIIAAEDKIVGELEYERLRKEYIDKKEETAAKYEAAQNKYNAVMNEKVKSGKKHADMRLAHEERLRTALSELKIARSQSEKATDDYVRVLPSISPSSLVASGSGVLSRERIARRREENRTAMPAPKSAERTERAESGAGLPQTYEPSRTPAASMNAVTLKRLLERLNALERYARSEKEQRARMRVREPGYAAAETRETKLERRRAQVVSMRKNLKYIDSPEAARDFKQRLYSLSISLDEDEMNDNVLSELIRRTMNDATAQGERAARAARTRNGYRGR